MTRSAVSEIMVAPQGGSFRLHLLAVMGDGFALGVFDQKKSRKAPKRE
jgi:hypothetical protein